MAGRSLLLALALVFVSACEGSGAEVTIVVRSSYARVGSDAVDRFALRVFRRSFGTRRWQRVSEHRYFFRSSALAAGVDAAVRDGGAVSLPDDEARIVLPRAESTAADEPVLLEVQAGARRSDDVFVPVGASVLAQFAIPDRGGRVVLTLEAPCRDVDLRALGAAGASLTCVVEAGASCPSAAPICMTFPSGTGTAVRTPCSRVEFDGGFASSCVDPGDGGMGTSIPVGHVVRRADCDGDEFCGSDGYWSRCVADPMTSSSCGRPGEACCPAPLTSSECVVGFESSRCAAQAACVDERCVACGALSAICCPGDVCYDGNCVAGRCAACGVMAAPCCAGDTCAPGLACVSGLCSTCGTAPLPCCSGDRCLNGQLCNAGFCTP